MRFDLPDDKKLVHESRIPIRWGDMDALGHVNNTVYFRYIEIARVEWMEAVGAALSSDGCGPVVVNAFCNFHRQLTYPGDLVAKLYVSNPGRSSLDTWVTLERADQPGVIAAAGGATVVWLDFQAQSATPLPDWLRALLG